jgi:predicted transcriptional regulator
METLSDSTIQKLSIVSKTRRGQIEILIDILTWASPRSGSKGVTKTHLAYASGLNFRRFEQYLDLLVQRKLIEIVGRSERELVASPLVYSRTAKGEEYA